MTGAEQYRSHIRVPFFHERCLATLLAAQLSETTAVSTNGVAVSYSLHPIISNFRNEQRVRQPHLEKAQLFPAPLN